VWALPDAGPATLLAQLPLGADLAAGATWAGELPAATLSAAVPGVIMVRLEVAGADDRAAGSPPGVFRLSLAPFLVAAPADTAAGPTAGPTAAPADDSTSIGDGAQPGPGASAGTTTGTGASGAEQAALPSPGPTAPAAGQGAGPAPSPVPAVNVTIQPVTPADPGTDALLGRPLPPVTVHPAATVQAAPSPSGGSSPTPTSSGVVAGLLAPIGPPAPSAGPAPTAAPELTYALQFAISVAPDGGVATVRVTNIGTGTIHSAGPVTNTPGTGTAPAQLTAALMVKAVPASGSAAGPLQLLVPLTSDLAPGATTNLAVRLPSLPQLRVSYLVSAQVVPAIPGETLTSSSTLFWMRGPVAAPIAVAATTAAVAGSAAGIGGSPAPGQAVVAVTTLAGTTATPASAVAWSSSAGPSAPSSATASSAAPFAGPSTPPVGSSSSAPSTPSAASDAGSVPYAATIIGHAMRQRADPRTR
ncbi:MAG TPA: hypothetical protein VNF73_03645, partial [Candidatus Saccharimonadales bacterium]|nr:hypothetical protein [Candidatus Saccharimonadales bacterium]